MTPVKPSQIQGWMGKSSRKWLRGVAKSLPVGARAVEVGSWRGRSTLTIANRMPLKAKLYAVDTWAGTPGDPEQHERLYADAGDVYSVFHRNLFRHIRRHRVVPLRMDSLVGAIEIERLEGLASLDFVFIDADHSYAGASGDIAAYLPLMRPGGLISGHDYQPNWPGVIQAVDEAFGDRAKIGPASIWSVRV